MKRQYDQLIWTDSFIKYQQQLLKPVYYLEAQKQYERLKKSFLASSLKHPPKINPNNIVVKGEIHLIKTDEFYKKETDTHFTKH